MVNNRDGLRPSQITVNLCDGRKRTAIGLAQDAVIDPTNFKTFRKGCKDEGRRKSRNWFVPWKSRRAIQQAT